MGSFVTFSRGHVVGVVSLPVSSVSADGGFGRHVFTQSMVGSLVDVFLSSLREELLAWMSISPDLSRL